MSKIFIIMGKSATGKDTIYKKLVEQEELNLKKIVSYTTRPIRKDEMDGVEYYFVTDQKREELIKQNKVIEHRTYHTVHGVWNYFTVDDGQVDIKKENYLMISTLEAYEQIRKFYGNERVIPIYIEVEDGLRLRRALNREQKQSSPKYAELCRRYLADEEDFSEKNLITLGIDKRYQNSNINICIQKIIDDLKIIM